MAEPVLLNATKQSNLDEVRFYTEFLSVDQDKDKVSAKLKERETGER